MKTSAIAMEHHVGTLQQLVDKQDPILRSPDGIIRLILGILKGIQHLAEHHIMHNDLKVREVKRGDIESTLGMPSLTRV